MGNIHITYARIRRVGLPTVKRIVDGYVARLLVVLPDFSGRQQQLIAPADVRARGDALARQLDLPACRSDAGAVSS